MLRWEVDEPAAAFFPVLLDFGPSFGIVSYPHITTHLLHSTYRNHLKLLLDTPQTTPLVGYRPWRVRRISSVDWTFGQMFCLVFTLDPSLNDTGTSRSPGVIWCPN